MTLCTWRGAILACALLAAACGFQLRGEVTLPFQDIHLAAPVGSPVARELNRRLQASRARIASDPAKAEARLVILEEVRDKIILSLSGAGRVREFQLKLRVGYHVTDPKGAPLIDKSEVNLTRIMSYDDALVLAKQQEEALLYKDMENDVVQQIMRRLANIRRTPG